MTNRRSRSFFNRAHLVFLRAYLFLQVLEERVVQQFGLFIEALEAVDAKSAALLSSIVRDEQNHVRYCVAISSQYAPTQAILEANLAEFRVAEAAVNAQLGAASMAFIFDQGVFKNRPA